MQWKDISTYKRGDKTREIRTVQLEVASGLRLVVTRHIHYAPDEWVLNCEPWFSNFVVGNGTLAEAKEAAVHLVRERLAMAQAALAPKAPAPHAHSCDIPGCAVCDPCHGL